MRRIAIPLKRLPVAGVFILLAAAAGAAYINATGTLMNLPTTDLPSGAEQANAAGGRLLTAETPDVGIESVNAEGATLIIEPLDALAGQDGPQADFTASPLEGAASLHVDFTDHSATGPYSITSWSWDFGDGSPEAAEQNPSHDYNSPGTYTVTLTITTPFDATAKTRTDYISVGTNVPAANGAGLALLMVALAMLGLARLRYTRKPAGMH